MKWLARLFSGPIVRFAEQLLDEQLAHVRSHFDGEGEDNPFEGDLTEAERLAADRVLKVLRARLLRELREALA